MTELESSTPRLPRRNFLRGAARAACLLGIGAGGAYLVSPRKPGESVWQLDPAKCIACGNCAKYCVLRESAVKCVHSFPMCGYCELCTGFFNAAPNDLTTAAENVLCPTGAIQRHFVEDPYFEYKIDQSLCIGCGKCVKGCTMFGNGSLYLQVIHDRCLNCNQCSIAAACPSGAFSRVPAAAPYLWKRTN